MEVTGSGSNPSLLPLDIPYAKAVDWLVERRIVAKGSYQKALRTAHAEAGGGTRGGAAAGQGRGRVPSGGPHSQGATYFDCVRVLEALKAEPGFDEKSFLAHTPIRTLRWWADVVKRFESGSVFLVDTAQYLVHQCTYELPASSRSSHAPSASCRSSSVGSRSMCDWPRPRTAARAGVHAEAHLAGRRDGERAQGRAEGVALPAPSATTPSRAACSSRRCPRR